MEKRLIVRLALAATLWAAILALPAAPVAAETCPAPGTGLAGAKNMIAADGGMTHAMSVDAPQGNAGMRTAVLNTVCPAP